MELKLVYRALRKISDWTVSGYYSETYIEGQENVPKDGPLIIAATHHNEIIDIATLSVTIPHRRHLSFWANSALFANPVAGAILSSSGAIPVRRNPNNGATPPAKSSADPSPSSSSSSTAVKNQASTSNSNATELAARSALFLNTSKALSQNQVVGVFPEGASYTHAKILQVMPGTAWAAVEYARYAHEVGMSEVRNGRESESEKGKERASEVKTGLTIVPVAIVYTDKSRYRSRIYVKYGEPILLDSYANELFEGDTVEASKAIVKKITAQVQQQLSDMTANAPDWDTICAVSMARSILWGDENNIALKDWVEVSQRLVEILVLPSQRQSDPTSTNDSTLHLKEALTKYYALLHYAGIKHSILLSLLPLSSSSTTLSISIPPPHSLPNTALLVLTQPTLSILSSLPLSLIQFLLFLPPFLLHFPGYISGSLIAKAFTRIGEEESLAQFKAVGGGLGIGANVALALGVLWKQNRLGTLSALLGLGSDDASGMSGLKRALGLVGTVYVSVLVLVKWHKLLVGANYRQLQRLLTYCKLFSAFALPRTADRISTAEVEEYSKPPQPAVNLYIKRREATSSPTPSQPSLPSSGNGNGNDESNGNVNGDGRATDNTSASESEAHRPPKPIASRKLVRHLLHARAGACAALSAHLKAEEDETLLPFLTSRGAKIHVL